MDPIVSSCTTQVNSVIFPHTWMHMSVENAPNPLSIVVHDPEEYFGEEKVGRGLHVMGIF